MDFSKLGLPSELFSILKSENYSKPYPIQERAIPKILEGKDVLGIAPTGSGKTAAFVLPILARLKKSRTDKNRHIDVLLSLIHI